MNTEPTADRFPSRPKSRIKRISANTQGSLKPDEIVLGIDCEWKLKQQKENKVLSYQFFAAGPGQAEWKGIEILSDRRIKLLNFLRNVIRRGLKEKKIQRWPKRVTVVCHFGLGDLASFDDFQELAKVLQPVRGTFVSSGVKTRLMDESRHYHDLTIIFRDTYLLAPQGKQALKQIGELCGVEKIEIAEDYINDMEYCLHEDRETFVRYALRDPQICVAYALRLRSIRHQVTGSNEVPISLSSIAVDALFQTWRTSGIDSKAVLGLKEETREEWNSRKGLLYRTTAQSKLEERSLDEALAKQCYHGGRNEQFLFGAAKSGVWTDYDLSGAYTTAMATIGMPLWREMYQTTNVADYGPDTLGYAWIDFKFARETRFPCLPVRSASGLIFPLSGTTYCCAPEIHQALQMGATVRVKRGVILPVDTTVKPFHSLIARAAERRKLCEKGTLEELLWKEMANSLYGKSAQGLRQRRSYDPATDRYGNLPESKISNPYIAAYITSFIRAILGQILHRLPTSVQVCSATTDGFLSTATPSQIEEAASGDLCLLFRRTRVSLGQSEKIIEEKHKIAQPLGWRTRGQATLEAINGSPIILSKAGLKPPHQLKTDHDQNEWIVKLFVNREPDTKINYQVLRNLVDLLRNGGDLTPIERTVTVRMEYDWKRKPTDPSMRPIRGLQHLAFETVPWNTVAEYESCRATWEKFAGKQGAVLKTLDDFNRFENYRAVRRTPGFRISRTSGAVGFAKRLFLIALTHGRAGLSLQGATYSEIATWLSDNGYATKKSDLENAKREKRMPPNSVELTHSVQAFLEVVLERFPQFRAESILHP